MSSFGVPIKRILAIEPHPNADAIELAVIDGYRSIVKKGQFSAGDLVAYLPEQALLPEWLLQKLGFWNAEKGKGTLNGPDGNRIKAIKLRGELSQGICLDGVMVSDDSIALDQPPYWPLVCYVPTALHEGDDVAAWLGIKKWEPPIPVSMAGDVFNVGQDVTVNFDVENWKAYPDVLQHGEDVVFTEKIHGTFCGVTVLPVFEGRFHDEAFGVNSNILIWSKGLGSKGLVFKNNDANSRNLYVRATRALIERINALEWVADVPIHLMGEVFGSGVQDLAYGMGNGEVGFRLFAIAVGQRGELRYRNWDEVEIEAAAFFDVPTVPVLYRGPFSVEAMRAHTDGQTTLGHHIREGIVMVPAAERYDPRIGRVTLKSVSADYLTRKGGSEFQ